MIGLSLTITACMLAALPAVVFFRNRRLYRPAPHVPPASRQPPQVSVLIPARNEVTRIADCVRSVLACRDIELEVLVLDDQSTDRTAEVVTGLAQLDSRVRLLAGQPVPAGWCGKQYACWQLAEAARFDTLVFLDADVRLSPDALVRSVAHLEQNGIDLLSGVPRQITGTFLERLLIPLIHFLLLGYLPLDRMRRSTAPAYAAGCGQLFLTRRDAYRAAGGHAAIRNSLHDGLMLPHAYRQAGLRTDLFDATDVATCRMYATAGQVLSGLSKNASEGVGHPARIVPFTVLLLGGHVLPPALLIVGVWNGFDAVTFGGGFVATGLSLFPRVASLRRFRQSLSGALLHCVAIILFLGIQWTALLRRIAGGRPAWKGRRYRPPRTVSAGPV